MSRKQFHPVSCSKQHFISVPLRKPSFTQAPLLKLALPPYLYLQHPPRLPPGSLPTLSRLPPLGFLAYLPAHKPSRYHFHGDTPPTLPLLLIIPISCLSADSHNFRYPSDAFVRDPTAGRASRQLAKKAHNQASPTAPNRNPFPQPHPVPPRSRLFVLP